ncbi:AI-2E family transporter [Flavobacterium zepuense]|uniref:AI-2E family transporter n=1 Tax=Flavobacterium zepuense TaxID=2593302 RepID=A0A552UYI2_9FLAO|nr:AI-2E family transporter [Flavobacterium zepuense]TRW23251.1 AI-2E family transporter [Flavobacterium zepuense]
MIKAIPFYTKLAHITICILGIGYLVIIGKTILAPLILALLFAMLLIPFANLLERKLHFSRGLACFLVLLVLVGVISGIMVLLGSQLTAFAQDIPAFEKQVMEALEGLQAWIAESFNIDNTKQAEYINNTTADALGTGTAIIGVTLMSLSSSLLFTVFIFLYTFFLLMHRSLLLRFVLALFHKNHSPVVLEAVGRIQYIIRKYILGLLLQMAIVATLSCIVFTVLGIKYAFLLGMLTGILNVIPYVGIFISMLLSIIVTFATATPNDILFVAIALSCIHLIDSNYIMPKIVGSKVKLNTLVAVIGLVVGELVWGITGMFLSIPVIAIAKVIFDRVEGLKPWGMVLGEDDTLAQTQKDVPADEELPPME